MKKKILVLAIVIAVLGGLLVGCAPSKTFAPEGENLAKGATYTVKGGKTSNTCNVSGSVGKVEVTINFPKEVTFNTILLNEKTGQVDSFELWRPIKEEVMVDGKLELVDDLELFYKQEEIGGLRYCYTGSMTMDKVVLRAFSFDRDNFTINKFEAYNIKREQKDFRTTTYLPMDQFLTEYAQDKHRGDGLNHVTDIILFGGAFYDENGDIDYEAQTIEKTVAIINDIRKDNPTPVRIFQNFLLRHFTKNDKELPWEKFQPIVQKMALKDNKDKLINNLVAFTDKYHFAGIAFDYETPTTIADYNVFGDFLIDFKAAMGKDRLVAIAVAPWGLKFNKAARDAVDMFEIMSYDMMDKNANHASWQFGGVKGIDYMLSNGYEASKIDFGIPFYSRPVDYGENWSAWKDDVHEIPKFSNYAASERVVQDFNGKNYLLKARWHNGEYMCMDKTTLCYDMGLGGVMIFQYNCDVNYDAERSLMRSINSVFQ